MILLVLCRDDYLPDGADPINLAGRWSPGNAWVVPRAGPLPDGHQCPMFVSPLDPHRGLQAGPPLKVGSGRIIFRPKVRIIIG
jgi:hypothetical protein